MTVRTAPFVAAAEGGSATIESVSAAANPGLSTRVIGRAVLIGSSEADVGKDHISAGRSLGSSEKFQQVILPVADKLGASRAAVDAGYAPNDWQVGQTGKLLPRSFTSPAASRVLSSIWRT